MTPVRYLLVQLLFLLAGPLIHPSLVFADVRENQLLSTDYWLRITERHFNFITQEDIDIDYNDVDWLMSYGRSNLATNWCMAVFLETRTTNGFSRVHYLLKLVRVDSSSNRENLSSEEFSDRGVRVEDGIWAKPANSICKDKIGRMHLCAIFTKGYHVDYFEKKVVGNMRQYSANYNAAVFGLKE